MKAATLETPDGRYIILRGRLWRKTNPHPPDDERKRLVSDLMSARRAVKDTAGDERKTRTARDAVDAAKVALGERGPVRWTDGAPDLTRRMARTTEYADWYRDASAPSDDGCA